MMKKVNSVPDESKLMTKNSENESVPDTLWPPDLHKWFLKAISVIPDCGRHKIPSKYTGIYVGRNEVLSEYITHKSGVYRSPKQVSSHLQVYRDKQRKKSSSNLRGKKVLAAKEVKQNVHSLRHLHKETPKAALEGQSEGIRFWDPDSSTLVASFSSLGDDVKENTAGASYVENVGAHTDENLGENWEPDPFEDISANTADGVDFEFEPPDEIFLSPLIPNTISEAVLGEINGSERQYHELRPAIDFSMKTQIGNFDIDKTDGIEAKTMMTLEQYMEERDRFEQTAIGALKFQIVQIPISGADRVGRPIAKVRIKGPIGRAVFEERSLTMALTPHRFCTGNVEFVQNIFQRNRGLGFYGGKVLMNLDLLASSGSLNSYFINQKLKSFMSESVKIKTLVFLGQNTAHETVECVDGKFWDGSYHFSLRIRTGDQVEEFLKFCALMQSFEERRHSLRDFKILQTIEDEKTEQLLLCLLLHFEPNPLNCLRDRVHRCSLYRIVGD